MRVWWPHQVETRDAMSEQVTDDERREHARLLALRAWSPRFSALDARIRREATQAWRKLDVFNDDGQGD